MGVLLSPGPQESILQLGGLLPKGVPRFKSVIKVVMVSTTYSVQKYTATLRKSSLPRRPRRAFSKKDVADPRLEILEKISVLMGQDATTRINVIDSSLCSYHALICQ